MIPEKYHGITGHLKLVEAEFLYEIPSILGQGTYVNLGTLHGRSPAMLAAGIKEFCVPHSKVITVDINDVDTKVWEDRGIGNLIVPFRGTTTQAFNMLPEVPVNFVFIDADHSYDAVREDFSNWSKLTDHIAFHDSTTAGVAKFLSEIEGWTLVKSVFSITYWRRNGQ